MALSLELVFDELTTERIKTAAERLEISPAQLLMHILMMGLRQYESAKETDKK
jgi:hypothetical protein